MSNTKTDIKRLIESIQRREITPSDAIAQFLESEQDEPNNSNAWRERYNQLVEKGFIKSEPLEYNPQEGETYYRLFGEIPNYRFDIDEFYDDFKDAVEGMLETNIEDFDITLEEVGEFTCGIKKMVYRNGEWIEEKKTQEEIDYITEKVMNFNFRERDERK